MSNKQEQFFLYWRIAPVFALFTIIMFVPFFLCSLAPFVSFRPLPVALRCSASDLSVAVLDKGISAERADPDRSLDLPVLSFFLCGHIVRYLSCQRQPGNVKDGFNLCGKDRLLRFWISADAN